MLLSRRDVVSAIPVSLHLEPMYARRASAAQETTASRDAINLYNINDPFQMTVLGVQYLNVSDVDRVSQGIGWEGEGVSQPQGIG